MGTVVRRDGRPGVLPDVATVIGGKDHRQRHGDVSIPDLFAVRVKGHLPALAEPAPGIGELHAHLMLARGQGAIRFDEEVLHAAEIIAVLELAALRVQAPSADVGALGNDDPFAPDRARRSPP